MIEIGPLTADAVIATIGDGREFSHGRQLSAWLGLTPTQHCSGGKQRLGEISRRGDTYLRTLLIQGARSSLQRANVFALGKASGEKIWIRATDATPALRQGAGGDRQQARPATAGRCWRATRTTTPRPASGTRWCRSG